MEELHTDSIDGGSEAIDRPGHVPGRGRTPTTLYEVKIGTKSDLSKLRIFGLKALKIKPNQAKLSLRTSEWILIGY